MLSPHSMITQNQLVPDDWSNAVPPPLDQIDVTVRQFLTFGLGYLPHEDIAGLIARADEGFERFLGAVEADDGQYAYGKANPNDLDTGLIRRRDEEAHDGRYDNKDYFHFRYELLENRAFHRHREWLMTCVAILNECRHRVRDFILALEKRSRTSRSAHLFCREETLNEDVLRIIHYRKTRPDTKIIARRHRGRAGVVLQVWENYPGLQGFINNRWTPLGSSPTHFLCFAGLKLTQLSNGAHPALDHEVIHVRGAEHVQRRAIVAFINPFGVDLRLPTHNY